MPRLCRLAALVVTMCAVMAVTTASASAAEVIQEATGVHCAHSLTENTAPFTPEVASSGGGFVCPVRATATDFELGGAFGVMVTCDTSLEGYASEAGLIIFGSYSFDSCETGSAQVCTVGTTRHARMTITSPFTLWMNICTTAFGLENRCFNVSGALNRGAFHTYSFSFVHTSKCANGVNSLQGTFTQVIDAAHPKFEVR